MNSDATEAALGLLGLSPLNAPQSQPQPHHPHVAHAHGPSLTSTAVGIAIDRMSSSNHVQSALPPSFVPLKRKQPSPALPTTTRGISPTTTPLPISTSRDTLPIKSAQRQSSHPLATSSTPPIKSTRPLPNVPTKSSTGPSRRYSQQRSFSPSLNTSLPPQTPPTAQLPLASPSTSQHPLSLADPPPPPDSDAISCICGFTYDDGFSIACDDCSRWCHAACFGIVQGEVPEFWKCWVCNPEVEVDKERAVKIQKGRLKAMRLKASHGANGGAAGAGSLNGLSVNTGMDDGSGGAGKPTSRRKTSPGVERKPRRGSAVAAAIDGSGPSKKRRRASMLAPGDPSPSSAMGPPTSNQAGPSTQPHSFHASSSRISLPNGPPVDNSGNANPTPITFPPDIYSHPLTHAQLLRVAGAWRGVTALNPPSPLINPPRTYIDGGYTRVASQEYDDRYGYSMSPLDNTTPVILDENAGDIFIPRTVLRTDPPSSYSQPLRHPSTHLYSPSHLYPNSHLVSNTPSAATHTPSTLTHTPPHLLRPPSPRFHVAAEPSPFVQAAACATSPVSNSSVPYPTPSTSLHPQPRSYAKSPLTSSTNTTPSLNAHSTSYLNTSHTIPASTLLAPYTATIVPSSAYLADPLNGYAHLGMGKPQVRLVGGGWGVGIDAREIRGSCDAFELGDKGGTGAGKEEDVGGGKARWARCGCWPNAVLRPVICAGTRAAENKGEKGRQHRAGCDKAESRQTEVAVSTDNKDDESPRTPDDESSASLPKTQPQAQSRRTDDSSDQEDPASDSDTDPTTLSFALFALRDLKAEEEIVLGWEWDDGHAVHMLPALMESPGMFGPAYLHHLRAQFTSILHALSSTFTTCACGSSTRDCAVRVMERVVEGRWPWPGREMTPEGSGDESSEGEQGWEDGDGDVDVEGDGDGMVVDLAMEIDIDGRPRPLKKRKVRKKSKDKDKDLGRPNPKGTVDLGPLVGVKRGFRTREKVPMSGGWCGVEVVPSSLAAFPELGTDGEENLPGTRKGKGKGKKAWKGKTKVDEVVLKPGVPDKDDRMDVDDSTATIPPRMRKPWVQSPASQSELSEDHSPRDHRQGAEIWGWRSPPETSAESPVSVSGADVEGNIGQDQGVTARSANVNGNGHDGADGQDGANGQDAEFDTDTEADGVDDTRQMPPPPMPASLDPTTVSSLAHACGGRSASPRLPVQWEKSGSPRVSTTWIPPQVPTPTSATIARTSQSPNQTHHPVTPALSYTSVPASSPPPLVHQHDALSSVSLPSPAHAEAQPHPSALAQTQPLAQAQLLPPTVSPSAPFSQLSLHSPDAASLFPHQSILFGSGEGTFLSPASAPAPESTYSIARKRVSSPPPHKPSKPLHVHPQNEPPSVSTPASVPVVRIESPDAIRDTPTQAQHQHRSSPESPHHALASPDAEKARTAEAHRVRFASPEVLSGLSGLTERAGMGDIKDADVSVEDDVVQVDGDAMDVDVDVVGDESSGDGSGPGHRPSFDRRRLHRISKDEPQPLHAATSPRSEAQFLPQSLTLPEPIHSPAPEHDSSPPSPQTQPHPPSESESELMLSEPEPPQPPREASPPPPPKVKMSLKDFALRKKKQREEEMAAKALTSPGSSDDHGLPPSPNVDGKRDLVVDNAGGAEENEEKVGFREVVNDVDVQMKDATVAHARDVSFPSVNGNVVNVELNGRDDDDPSVPPKPPKPVQDQQTPRVEKKTSGVMVIAPPPDAAQPSPRFAPPLTPLPRASGESTVQTQINGRTDAAPVTLKAKVEMMDSVIPSGLVAAYGDCADAVSFAPEPPPPPLTTKQTSDANVAEGRRTTAPASTPTSSINSRSTSTGITVSAPSHSNHVPHAHIPTSIPLSRKPSHEDGEITSSTPPKTYLPRSYTPPTQPRSFHATHPPSPNLGPTSSSSSSSSAPAPRRPAPPPLSRSPLSNAAGPAPVPISSRPLPSGPRALRGSMSQPTQPPPYASTRPPYVGSQYIPRGPSADRDRLDWDRDRQWAASSRSRGRAGSNGWGR